jgi:hypothetical protein
VRAEAMQAIYTEEGLGLRSRKSMRNQLVML